MAKGKITKVEMQISESSFVDITDDFSGIRVYDANGVLLVEQECNESRLRKLDKKYEQILKDIVSK